MTTTEDSDPHDGPANIFEKALSAASEAFEDTIDRHFGRTFDNSDDDYERLLDEYRESSRLLRDGAMRLHVRTGLVDADFMCWHSGLADENFAGDSEERKP